MAVDFATPVKERVTTRDACEMYGIPVNPRGYCRCPFHNEKTASMKVYPGKGGWYCFGCGKGGDVVDLVSGLFGLDTIKAIDKLNRDFNLHLPVGESLTETDRAELDRLASRQRERSAKIRAAIETAQKDYQMALDAYCQYDTVAREKAPHSPFEDFTDDYARAVKKREQAWYRVKAAEDRLDRALERRNIK